MKYFFLSLIFFPLLSFAKESTFKVGDRVYSSESISATFDGGCCTVYGNRFTSTFKYFMGAGTIKAINPDGTIKFQSDETPGLEFTLKTSKLLAATPCEFLGKKANSSATIAASFNGGSDYSKTFDYFMGSGMPKEAFGSCSEGVVTFISDKTPGLKFNVPASSINKKSSQTTRPTSQPKAW